MFPVDMVTIINNLTFINNDSHILIMPTEKITITLEFVDKVEKVLKNSKSPQTIDDICRELKTENDFAVITAMYHLTTEKKARPVEPNYAYRKDGGAVHHMRYSYCG